MFAAKTTIQLPDGSVAQEHNRRVRFLRANRRQSFLGKRAPLLRFDLAPPLTINDFDHCDFWSAPAERSGDGAFAWHASSKPRRSKAPSPLRSAGRTPNLYLALLRVRFVGLDDHLHQFVAHDVLFAEVDEFDALDAGQHPLSFDQAAALARRQIDLGYVAGDYCLRTKSDARQKQLHLLTRRVLRFVEDHERIR